MATKKTVKKAPAKKASAKKLTGMQKFVGAIEAMGNKLPHPMFLFAYIAVIVGLFSIIGSQLNWGNPMADGSQMVKNIFNKEGLEMVFTEFINNFSKYGTTSIFGTIILLTMAVGVGTSTGYWQALIKKMTNLVPKHAVSYVVAGIGAFTSIASDAGYVVFVPLAAIIFVGYGRSPLAGIAAAFSGVSAGFSATLIPGASDAIFAEVWDSFSADYGFVGIFTATTTWFFQAASLIMIAFVGGWVTDKIVEPAVAKYDTKKSLVSTDEKTSSSNEVRGLKFANWTLLAVVVIFVLLSWPGFGPLSYGNLGTVTWSFSGAFELVTDVAKSEAFLDWVAAQKEGAPVTVEAFIAATAGYGTVSGDYVQVMSSTANMGLIADMVVWAKSSTFMRSISLNLGIMFFAAGIAYGYGSGSITHKNDIVEHEKNSLKGIGSFIVVSIVSLNMIAWLNYSNLGATMTGHIGKMLIDSGMGSNGMIIMLPAVFILTTLLNLIIGGMSSKGYILGPIFLGLAQTLGLSDGDVVAIGMMYRIADSCTNIITPIMTYFVVILAFAQAWMKKEDDFGAGNLIAMMMPYSIAYMAAWVVLFIVWYLIGIPFGI